MKNLSKTLNTFFITLLIGAAVLFAAPKAMAATINVNNLNPNPGETVTINGSCTFPLIYTLSFGPTGGLLSPISSGVPPFVFLYTIPLSTTLGSYDFQTTCPPFPLPPFDAGSSAIQTVQVVAPASPSSSSTGGAPASIQGSTTNAPSCGNPKPNQAPDLFQINTASNSATIYFTPINGNVSSYFVAFGYQLLDERFGGKFEKTSDTGVQNITINYLTPWTTYYLRVRGQNGCMPGDWSNTLKFTTNGNIFYKYDANHNVIPLIP